MATNPNFLPSRQIAGLPFYGPATLVDAPMLFDGWIGIYVVATPNDIWLDVGTSEKLTIGGRIASHERKACWQRHAIGAQIVVYAHPDEGDFSRYLKENSTRLQLQPKCGKE